MNGIIFHIKKSTKLVKEELELEVNPTIHMLNIKSDHLDEYTQYKFVCGVRRLTNDSYHLTFNTEDNKLYTIHGTNKIKPAKMEDLKFYDLLFYRLKTAEDTEKEIMGMTMDVATGCEPMEDDGEFDTSMRSD